jgi:3-methyladenine DNA glycosylase AlkD
VLVEVFTKDTSLHPEIIKRVKMLENDEEYYVRKAVEWIKRNLKKGK